MMLHQCHLYTVRFQINCAASKKPDRAINMGNGDIGMNVYTKVNNAKHVAQPTCQKSVDHCGTPS